MVECDLRGDGRCSVKDAHVAVVVVRLWSSCVKTTKGIDSH